MLDLSRRSFFAGLGALIAAPAIVKASSLMPVTGGVITRPVLVLPPCGKNSLLTIEMITREAIQLFRNSNKFIQSMSRDYDDAFSSEGLEIGTSLRIRLLVEDHWMTFHEPGWTDQDTAFVKAHTP